jgi:glutamine amidotransferase
MQDIKLKKVVIIDYQLGNLFSVKQACDVVGLQSFITSDKKDIYEADAIILPGVGAFREAMCNLKELDMIEPLKDFVQSGKPLFGICLGLQLLFTESEEFGSNGGLNFINGYIRKFTNSKTLNKNAKVPHIGWNKIVECNNSFGISPLIDVSNNEFMYFVHSYYVEATNSNIIISKTIYEGVDFCSSISFNSNIFATQFHPEKSGKLGVSIYRNWAIQNNLIKPKRI